MQDKQDEINVNYEKQVLKLQNGAFLYAPNYNFCTVVRSLYACCFLDTDSASIKSAQRPSGLWNRNVVFSSPAVMKLVLRNNSHADRNYIEI